MVIIDEIIKYFLSLFKKAKPRNKIITIIVLIVCILLTLTVIKWDHPKIFRWPMPFSISCFITLFENCPNRLKYFRDSDTSLKIIANQWNDDDSNFDFKINLIGGNDEELGILEKYKFPETNGQKYYYLLAKEFCEYNSKCLTCNPSAESIDRNTFSTDISLNPNANLLEDFYEPNGYGRKYYSCKKH